ncbi:MAG: ABC transporter ATP-binding protein [Bacteroidota bacterium]|jgi:lipopolysaccharide transport system ATP-binding protein
MVKKVISVEHVSKVYRLGEIGTGALSADVNRWWVTKVLGKEDPYLKIGQVNDRSTKGDTDVVYSLKDVSFDVEQGEVLGIIGKNGAGKSTLLKILSRITAPSTGRVRMKGRVASLLEVGTGFHPELTGRENIYLNGSILGMRKHEIDRKFDEIVDFSGVERYVDTPVKRYSSGMYVRLAFAVAAHLESEILIVDEVLAVGDAEFQKKCLGRMKDVSTSEGRTVLFVSHNMSALQKICNKAVLISNGEIAKYGFIKDVVDAYASSEKQKTTYEGKQIGKINNGFVLKGLWIETNNGRDDIFISDSFKILISFSTLRKMELNLTFIVLGPNDEHVLSCPSLVEDGSNQSLSTGEFLYVCNIPANFFNSGIYRFIFLAVEDYNTVLMEVNDALVVNFDEDLIGRGRYLGPWNGLTRPKWKWEFNQLAL